MTKKPPITNPEFCPGCGKKITEKFLKHKKTCVARKRYPKNRRPVTREFMIAIGRRGGLTVSQNKEHMKAISRLGVEARWNSKKTKSTQ